jgi:hypothetical protein
VTTKLAGAIMILAGVMMFAASLASPGKPGPCPQGNPLCDCECGSHKCRCDNCYRWCSIIGNGVRRCPAGKCDQCRCVDESKCGTPQGACSDPKLPPLPANPR